MIFIYFVITIIFIVILLKAFNSVNEFKSKSISQNVSTNYIRYPSQIKCISCKKTVFPLTKNIDKSTWDLKCTCGEIVYLHPKREERIEQIKNFLN